MSTSGQILVTMNGVPIIRGHCRMQSLCRQSQAFSYRNNYHISLTSASKADAVLEARALRVFPRPTACGLIFSNVYCHITACAMSRYTKLIVAFAESTQRNQYADGFTKALPGPAFFAFRSIVLHSPNYQKTQFRDVY